jgi:hypothetical protein
VRKGIREQYNRKDKMKMIREQDGANRWGRKAMEEDVSR